MSYIPTYDEIKAKCLKEGLFEDPDFRADDSTLCYNPLAPPKEPYEWKRPKEIQKILRSTEPPEFFVGGASRFDIMQDQLGDCWMLASMSCLSMHPDLLKEVVPDGQSFKDGEYAGIFRFNLWSFGKWVEVIIDDRLPTNDEGLVYTSSSQKNEFWTALLEKAFAKLYGGYKAIQGGKTTKALEHFTGGIGEVFQLGPQAPLNLWNIMLKARERKSLMCCATRLKTREEIENVLPNGLVPGHAYSVTRVILLNTRQFDNLNMVRVRNPWGFDDKKWDGDWNDDSPKWNQISESERQMTGFVKDVQNGEFWMTFEEFVKNFNQLYICHLGPESLTDDADLRNEKRWITKCIKGCWKEGISAGGHVNGRNAWINPQYGLEVGDVYEGEKNDAATVIIELMQQDRRKKVDKNLQIGYAIYQVALIKKRNTRKN